MRCSRIWKTARWMALLPGQGVVCVSGGFSPLVWKILQVQVACISNKHLHLPWSAQTSTAAVIWSFSCPKQSSKVTVLMNQCPEWPYYPTVYLTQCPKKQNTHREAAFKNVQFRRRKMMATFVAALEPGQHQPGGLRPLPPTGRTQKIPQGPLSWLCKLMGAWFWSRLQNHHWVIHCQADPYSRPYFLLQLRLSSWYPGRNWHSHSSAWFLQHWNEWASNGTHSGQPP